MLSFKDFLNEIFQKPYPFKRYASPNNVQYEFNTSDNRRVTVVFRLDDYKFDFISKNSIEGWELFFDVNGMMHITGGGDSFMVLSTVVEIAKDFIIKNKPQLLVFTADKNDKSRVDLYSSMVKKLIRLTDFAYQIPRSKSSENQEFVLYIPR